MRESRDSILTERASRSWAALDATTRILNRRSRFAHPFDLWYRAFRRDPVGRSVLAVGLALCIIATFRIFFHQISSRHARLITAAGAPAPSITVAEAVSFILMFALFGVINLILLLWIRPRRTARILEAHRLRRADRLAAQMSQSPDAQRVATAAVIELRRAAGARGDRLRVNAVWQGLVATNPAYVASQWAGVALMMLGQVALSFVSRPGVAGPFRSLSMVGLFVMLWVVVRGVQVPIRRVRKRLLATLTDRACPECGYDLRSLTEAADPEMAVLGPRACPECGVRWPLVPPRLVG